LNVEKKVIRRRDHIKRVRLLLLEVYISQLYND